MQLLYNQKDQTTKRQRLRKRMSTPEVLLWSRLRSKQLQGYKFRRQYGIGKYIVDFYCPGSHLAIEIDGDSHSWDNHPEYDAHRQANIESLGIRVLRFTNDDVMENIEGVLEKIKQCLA